MMVSTKFHCADSATATSSVSLWRTWKAARMRPSHRRYVRFDINLYSCIKIVKQLVTHLPGREVVLYSGVYIFCALHLLSLLHKTWVYLVYLLE